MAQVTQTRAAPSAGPPRMAAVFRSELTKLRTLRATMWSLLAAVVIVLGLAAIICFANNNSNGDFLDYVNGSWALGQFAFLVLGVMTVSNEYSNGLITNSFLATPKRWRFLVAKILAFGLITIVITEVMSFANFFMGHAILASGTFYPIEGLGGHNVLRAVIGTGVYATLVGLTGMGLGALLRNTAAAIAVGVALLLILPGIVHILPTSDWHAILKFWPTEEGSEILGLRPDSWAFGAWWGMAYMVGFVAVLLSAAGALMTRRDT
jgi:ABC-2 type transport system permease protein